MIEFIKSYATSDGQVFKEISDAQVHEIGRLVGDCLKTDPQSDTCAIVLVRAIVENKDKVIDILTTTPTSKPKARKVNGGTKKRKSTPPAEPPAVSKENKPF